MESPAGSWWKVRYCGKCCVREGRIKWSCVGLRVAIGVVLLALLVDVPLLRLSSGVAGASVQLWLVECVVVGWCIVASVVCFVEFVVVKSVLCGGEGQPSYTITCRACSSSVARRVWKLEEKRKRW